MEISGKHPDGSAHYDSVVPISIGPAMTLDDVVRAAHGDGVELDPGARPRIEASRAVVEEVAGAARAVYGINTGIGDLATVRIDPDEAAVMQSDIVRSHATGTGAALPTTVVRAMLALKARTFAHGHSGVRSAVVDRIIDLLNSGIHPVVPGQGSLGASGDLAPLAHLALPLIGEGPVERSGSVVPAAEALRSAGLEPLELSHKEGLSLVNGTEGMLALGILGHHGAARLARSADVAAAMSVEACLGTDAVFAEKVISLRKHPGAPAVARNLRALLEGSEIVESHRDSEHLVQDAYSLRCIPQVHGAYRDGLSYVRITLEAELGSAIDNPSVFPETKEVRSSGNFHGEALAIALDHLGLCVTGFGTISERRTARLVDTRLSNGLPAFLTTDAGRRTGFMLVHYTAAALVNENRSLCWPASADSIPTSAGQEDHVSMGFTAARKALTILANTERVLAIEALAAAQGLDLRRMDPAPGTDAARACVRTVSPQVDEDRSLSSDIDMVAAILAGGDLVDAAESVVGPLA
jgi:histidine ammonia-lyase